MKYLFVFVLFVAICAIHARPGSSSESNSSEEVGKKHTKNLMRGGLQVESTVGRDKDGLRPIMTYPMPKKSRDHNEERRDSKERRVEHRNEEHGDGRRNSNSDEHRRVTGNDHKTNQVYRDAQKDNQWRHVEESNRKPMESHRGKLNKSVERHRTRVSQESNEEHRGGRRENHESGKWH